MSVYVWSKHEHGLQSPTSLEICPRIASFWISLGEHLPDASTQLTASGFAPFAYLAVSVRQAASDSSDVVVSLSKRWECRAGVAEPCQTDEETIHEVRVEGSNVFDGQTWNVKVRNK